MTDSEQDTPQLDAFRNAGGDEVEEAGFLGWLSGADLEIGDFVVGRVKALSTNENGRYFKMERSDGETFNFAVPTHVDSNYNPDTFVGDVVGIAYVEDMDVGRPSPMKIYEVRRFQGFPDVVGVEADAPF